MEGLRSVYHHYNEAWGHLKKARREGNYHAIAEAADKVAAEARVIIEHMKANKQELVTNCSHPRTDTNGICEVCGANLFEGTF